MKAVAVVALVVAASIARAEVPTPWTKGVSRATQARANKAFAAANELFAQQAHAPAVAKYREALALWDHPLIRFNLAVTLIRLDRIVEAAEELSLSLRFGAAPFPAATYEQALDYKALINGRVGDLEASCTQSSVNVVLDGKPWFSCPGKQRSRVLAGPHAVVAERDGYITRSERAIVVGGELATVDIELTPIDAAVRIDHRFPRWVPWTVTGAGVGVSVSGLAVWLVGRSRMDVYGADLARVCPDGCNLGEHPELADARSRAKLEAKVGVIVMSVGVAGIIAGVTLGLLNGPRRSLPVEVVPSEGGATALAGWSF